MQVNRLLLKVRGPLNPLQFFAVLDLGHEEDQVVVVMVVGVGWGGGGVSVGL